MQTIGAIDIAMTDTNNIWYVGSEAIIKTSTDGIPQLQYSNSSVVDFMNYIEMFDTNNGIVMGDKYSPSKAVFLKTTNGGSNWNVVSGSELDSMWSGDLWRRIDFVDINVGYFFESGVNPPKLLKTTDGGASWTETNFDKYANIIKFYDENVGLIYDNGKIFRTKNGGPSWDTISISCGYWGNDFEFMNGDVSKVWFLSEGSLHYSNDTGSTWMNVSINREGKALRDIIFTDDNNGWILGDGIVLHTSTGGLSNIKEQPNAIPTNYSLEQNYPNPFNPSTTIRFSTPPQPSPYQGEGVREGFLITLNVYDMLGQEITTLINEEKSPGIYEVSFDGSNLSSGIYFYKLNVGNFTQIKKMILMK